MFMDLDEGEKEKLQLEVYEFLKQRGPKDMSGIAVELCLPENVIEGEYGVPQILYDLRRKEWINFNPNDNTHGLPELLRPTKLRSGLRLRLGF
jgi:hypothetical protein